MASNESTTSLEESLLGALELACAEISSVNTLAVVVHRICHVTRESGIWTKATFTYTHDRIDEGEFREIRISQQRDDALSSREDL